MKKHKIMRSLLAVCLLIPAILIGYFLPTAAAIFQDRQLESAVSTYATEPVNLQMIPELSISEKLRLVSMDYSSIYNGINGGSTENVISTAAISFLQLLEAQGMTVGATGEIQERLAAPFLAIQADDTAKTAILWNVDLYFYTGMAVHMVVDDETGLVLAITQDLTDYLKNQIGDNQQVIYPDGGMEMADYIASRLSQMLVSYYGVLGCDVENVYVQEDGAQAVLRLYGATDADDIELTVHVDGFGVSINEQ